MLLLSPVLSTMWGVMLWLSWVSSLPKWTAYLPYCLGFSPFYFQHLWKVGWLDRNNQEWCSWILNGKPQLHENSTPFCCIAQSRRREQIYFTNIILFPPSETVAIKKKFQACIIKHWGKAMLDLIPVSELFRQHIAKHGLLKPPYPSVHITAVSLYYKC